MTKIRSLKLFVPAALLASVVSGAAFAEETAPSKAMVLTVRPSGYDASQTETEARRERLLKRIEQSDYMVRSICVQCGDHWKHQIYAPFEPLASLSPRNKTAEEKAR